MLILINIIVLLILLRLRLHLPYDVQANFALVISSVGLIMGIYYLFVPMKKTSRNVIRIEDLPAYSRAVGISMSVMGISGLIIGIDLKYDVFMNPLVVIIPTVVMICNLITMNVVTMRYKKRKRQEDKNLQIQEDPDHAD